VPASVLLVVCYAHLRTELHKREAHATMTCVASQGTHEAVTDIVRPDSKSRYFREEETKMAKQQIPDIVIGRLPIYLRALNYLIAEGRRITSSQELGDRLGISSAQIR